MIAQVTINSQKLDPRERGYKRKTNSNQNIKNHDLGGKQYNQESAEEIHGKEKTRFRDVSSYQNVERDFAFFGILSVPRFPVDEQHARQQNAYGVKQPVFQRLSQERNSRDRPRKKIPRWIPGIVVHHQDAPPKPKRQRHDHHNAGVANKIPKSPRDLLQRSKKRLSHHEGDRNYDREDQDQGLENRQDLF